MYPTIRTKDRRKLKVKVLIDSRYMNTTITRKTIKEKGISTKSLPKPFDVYNSDRSKNREKQSKNYTLRNQLK